MAGFNVKKIGFSLDGLNVVFMCKDCLHTFEGPAREQAELEGEFFSCACPRCRNPKRYGQRKTP